MEMELFVSCICDCLQRNPAGNSAAAASARGGVPASTWQSPAEPHPAGRATASQVALHPELKSYVVH